MENYYMISNVDLPEFMKTSLIDAYKIMAKIKNRQEFNQLMEHAPSFIFAKTNDFIQAIKTDFIVILVPPDKYYEFEILGYDPYRNRIFINSMEFKRITQENFAELILDNYPINIST